jgi:hypothetical protein
LLYRFTPRIRPLRCSLFLATAVALLALPASAQVTVTATNGTLFETTGLSLFSTNGAQMDGMLVTANFVGGGSQTLAWADLSASTGGVTGTGWSLANTGTTTFDTGSWILTNTSAPGISSLVLNGAPGNTIFDRTIGGAEGTPGSSGGVDFAVTSGLSSYAINANYTNILRLNANPPVGDLFTRLDITFTSPAGGFTAGSTMRFTADTDNAAAGAVIIEAGGAPEPGSLALLGGLLPLAGFVVFTRRRRVK